LDALPPAKISEDGTFLLSGLPEGRVILSVTGVPTVHLDRVTLGNQDVRDQGFELTGDVRGLVVVLTPRLARVSGRVIDSAGKPRPDAYILRFPKLSTHWNEWTIIRARPDRSGNFELAAPPGEYVVAAVAGGLPDDWRSAEFLSSISPRGLAVKLGGADIGNQQLRVQLRAARDFER
jgi:hypothetical protein